MKLQNTLTILNINFLSSISCFSWLKDDEQNYERIQSVLAEIGGGDED